MESHHHNHVLVAVVYLAGELEILQLQFPEHPCRHHFKHGVPRLHTFTIKHKDVNMSSSQTPAVTYLSTASTDFIVAAFDQYGFPYTGADLANTTVTTDTPTNVGASLSAFTGSTATLTLTQAGGEGTAGITIANGAVTKALPVESYTPALTSFTITPAQVATPAPVAPVATSPAPAAATTTATSAAVPAGTITNTGTVA